MYKDILWYEWLYSCNEFWNVFTYPKKWSWWHNWKMLRGWFDKDWYLMVILSKNMIRKTYRIHRLIAQTFIANPNNLKVVMHLDNDPSNNNVANLKWWNQKENMQQKCREGRENFSKWEDHYMFWVYWENHHNSKKINQYSLDWILIKEWDCTATVVKLLWIPRTSISSCLHWRYKSAGWFVWKFIL